MTSPSDRRHYATQLWAQRTIERLQSRALAKLKELLNNPTPRPKSDSG